MITADRIKSDNLLIQIIHWEIFWLNLFLILVLV